MMIHSTLRYITYMRIYTYIHVIHTYTLILYTYCTYTSTLPAKNTPELAMAQAPYKTMEEASGNHGNWAASLRLRFFD